MAIQFLLPNDLKCIAGLFCEKNPRITGQTLILTLKDTCTIVRIKRKIRDRRKQLMDIRDKVVEIVYESKEGLFPLAIAEAVSKRYSIPVNSRQVEDVVRKNPKLFIEAAGKIMAPVHE